MITYDIINHTIPNFFYDPPREHKNQPDNIYHTVNSCNHQLLNIFFFFLDHPTTQQKTRIKTHPTNQQYNIYITNTNKKHCKQY